MLAERAGRSGRAGKRELLGLVVCLLLVAAAACNPRALPGLEPAASNAARVYFIDLEAGGVLDAIGCGDRALAVPIAVPAGADPLRVALERLLSDGERLARSNGLHDALARSRLEIRELEVIVDRVEVQLAGDLVLGGVCDAPRVEAQLKRTLTQFRSVREARIWINGVPLEEVLSSRG